MITRVWLKFNLIKPIEFPDCWPNISNIGEKHIRIYNKQYNINVLNIDNTEAYYTFDSIQKLEFEP